MGDSGPADAVIDDLMKLAPGDAEVVMLSAERALEAGRRHDALRILEEGSERIPDSVELREVRDLLRRRLS